MTSKPFIIAVVLTWLPLLAFPVGAAEPVLPGGASTDLFTTGLKMVGAMALLIGGLLLFLYFLRRFAATRNTLFGGQEPIRVMATKALAPKKYIALVEVGGAVLTLGVTNENISCLDKMTAEAFKEGVQQMAPMGPEPGFSQRLKALTGASSAREEEKQS